MTRNRHALAAILSVDLGPRGPYRVLCRCGWSTADDDRSLWTKTEARAAYRAHLADPSRLPDAVVVALVTGIGPVLDAELPAWSKGHREMAMTAALRAIEQVGRARDAVVTS